MSDEKRIKDFEAAVELLNDDWFAVDSPSQGTRKMQASMFQAGLQSQITANRDDIDLHSGQIATLQLGVGNLGNDVDALETKVGDATLQTTSPNLSGAINEHEGDINSINSSLAKVKFTKFTYTYDAVTIQANSNVTVNATNSKPSNLTHIAVEYFNSGNGNAFFRYINAGSGAMNIHNNSSSAITITPTLVVTCVDSTLV